MPTPLSIFSYVRNEAATLAKSLASIREIADELIVVDTGSTDGTRDIARKYADRVVEWTWRDDFAAAARFGEGLCTHRFVCKWDGDWWLESGSPAWKTLKERGFTPGAVYRFDWINEYDAQSLVPIVRNTNRFVYDRTAYRWVSPIHTHLTARENQASLEISVEDIVVYHSKDPARKQYRYAQTQHLLEQTLVTATGSNRIRLAKYAVSNAFFRQDYLRAGKYFEILFATPDPDPNLKGWLIEHYGLYLWHVAEYAALEDWIARHGTRFRQLALLDADLAVARNELALALEKYKYFLRTYPFDPREPNVSAIRHRDHPYRMLRILRERLRM